MKDNGDTYKTVVTDVIIIGGGPAGATAAIEARNFGVDVVLVDKGRFGFSGSACTSDGETSAVFLAEDSPEKYLQETLAGGESLNVPGLTRTLVYDSFKTVQRLSKYGVPYSRNANGEMELYAELGMKSPRTPKVLGGGPAFMLSLREETLHRGVRVYENMMVCEILTGKTAGVNGCIGVDIDTGKKTVFNAKAVVLAAGSATGLFPHATANYTTTGDGYWLGYTAGADFINMEFTELSVMPAPGGKPLHTGGIKPLTGRGAKFFNSLGERFMERYDPQRKEMVKRSDLVNALFREIKEGRGPVYMDLTHLPEEAFEKMEKVQQLGIIKKLKEIGVNYRKERFQWISPAVHTFLGGVRVNEDGQSSVSGLFSVGENAGGVYGADRVGTFLTACALFGFKTGRSAARHARATTMEEIDAPKLQKKMDELEKFIRTRNGRPPKELERKIKDIAGSYLSLDRHDEGLREAIRELWGIMDEELNGVEINCVDDTIKSLEIRNMALTGRLLAEAALRRKESRGQHRRSDYPKRDESWTRWIILSRDGTEIKARYEDIPSSG